MNAQGGNNISEGKKVREHYHFDYSRARPNRFADQFDQESVAVVLDPDVAAVFTTSEGTNQALRVLIAALGRLAKTPGLLDKVENEATRVDAA